MELLPSIVKDTIVPNLSLDTISLLRSTSREYSNLSNFVISIYTKTHPTSYAGNLALVESGDYTKRISPHDMAYAFFGSGLEKTVIVPKTDAIDYIRKLSHTNDMEETYININGKEYEIFPSEEINNTVDFDIPIWRKKRTIIGKSEDKHIYELINSDLIRSKYYLPYNDFAKIYGKAITDEMLDKEFARVFLFINKNMDYSYFLYAYSTMEDIPNGMGWYNNSLVVENNFELFQLIIHNESYDIYLLDDFINIFSSNW